jgi:hypothetical protein
VSIDQNHIASACRAEAASSTQKSVLITAFFYAKGYNAHITIIILALAEAPLKRALSRRAFLKCMMP